MSERGVVKYLLSLDGALRDKAASDEVKVYSIDGKMFALIEKGKKPVRLSLRIEPALSTILQQRYEEVMAGYKLSKNQWVTITMTGQLSWAEIKDLIDHSYNLAIST